jgi:hypothetical protein
MNRLNKIEKFFVYLLVLWTIFNLILWVTAKEAMYFQKEQFWPFVHSNGSYRMDVSHTYDFREFIIYTFVPWALFFMIDNFKKADNPHQH